LAVGKETEETNIVTILAEIFLQIEEAGDDIRDQSQNIDLNEQNLHI
jgi:hypothetical protein